MIQRSITEIAKMCGGRVINLEEDKLVQGVCIHSKEIKQNNLYVPFVGNRVDGHDFILEAFQQGAAISFCEESYDYSEIKEPLILVNNAISALQQLAKSYREQLTDLQVIAITGSNGKTSTKDILYELIKEKYSVTKTKGNQNNEIGVPLTILAIQESNQYAIVEMGMSALNEISILSEIAQPDMAIITSIGRAHLADLGSIEKIIQAKLEVLDGMKEDGYLFVNGDDSLLREMIEEREISQEVIYYGRQPSNMFEVIDCEQKQSSVAFTIKQFGSFELPVIGIHQALNATAAILLATHIGVTASQINQGLANVQITTNRNEVVQIGQSIWIDDTYKSNPESLKAALNTLDNMPQQYIKIAVLADMQDLGKDEMLYHQELGKYLNTTSVNYLYTLGELTKMLQEESDLTDTHKKHFDSKEELLEEMKKWLTQKAIILVKGAHAYQMDQLIKQLKEVMI